MSIYSAKYYLSSCKVSKELLKEIENYLIKESENYLSDVGSSKEKINSDVMKQDMYHVYVLHNENITRHGSIKEIEDGKLPNDISAVILEFTSFVDRLFHIKINFHSSISEHPSLEITVSDFKAKDISKVIADGVIKIVKAHRNGNHVFHSRLVQIGLLFLYAMYSVVNFLLMNYTQLYSPYTLSYNMIFAAVFSMLIVWFVISIFLRRYTTFNTKR